jgi:hypothetical protein
MIKKNIIILNKKIKIKKNQNNLTWVYSDYQTTKY